jgi:hypothetical protein
LEKRDWYAEDIDAVIEHLESDKGGLSEEEASRRLGVYGQNELKEEKKTTALELLIGQFKSILVIILIISAAVSAYISFREGEALCHPHYRDHECHPGLRPRVPCRTGCRGPQEDGVPPRPCLEEWEGVLHRL